MHEYFNKQTGLAGLESEAIFLSHEDFAAECSAIEINTCTIECAQSDLDISGAMLVRDPIVAFLSGYLQWFAFDEKFLSIEEALLQRGYKFQYSKQIESLKNVGFDQIYMEYYKNNSPSRAFSKLVSLSIGEDIELPESGVKNSRLTLSQLRVLRKVRKLRPRDRPFLDFVAMKFIGLGEPIDYSVSRQEYEKLIRFFSAEYVFLKRNLSKESLDLMMAEHNSILIGRSMISTIESEC